MNNSQTGFHILNKEYDVDFQELDDSQRGPVFSEDADILIRAPAGSGKTKCAISAIAKYKYDHVNDRVCAITFTRAARAEMSARLNEMGLYDVEVTTIHV